MKRTIALAVLTMSISLVHAQEKKSKFQRDRDFISFGVDAGVNRSSLAFSNATGSYSSPGSGFRVGFVTDFRLGSRFSILPKAEFSFTGAHVEDSDGAHRVGLSTMEVMAHLKYKTRDKRLSPYFLGGPNFRIPLVTRTQDGSFFTNENTALDLGVGLDVPVFKYTISPELRYSLGLSEMRSASSLGDLKYNNIAIMVIISGL